MTDTNKCNLTKDDWFVIMGALTILQWQGRFDESPDELKKLKKKIVCSIDNISEEMS